MEILWWFSCDVFDIKDDLLSLGHLIFLTPNATSLLQVPRINGTGTRSFRGYRVIGEPIHLRIIHLSCAIYFAVCFLDTSCLELHFQPFLNGWKWLNNLTTHFPCKELKSFKWNYHLKPGGCFRFQTCCHQEFQVPKMEVLNLIRLFWCWVFPYISLTYSLYRWVPEF